MSKFCISLVLLLFLGLFLSHVASNIFPVDHIAKYWINSTVFTLTGGVAVLVTVWAVWQYKIGKTTNKEAGKKAIMFVVTGLGVMAMCWQMIDWLQIWITAPSV